MAHSEAAVVLLQPVWDSIMTLTRRSFIRSGWYALCASVIAIPVLRGLTGWEEDVDTRPRWNGIPIEYVEKLDWSPQAVWDRFEDAHWKAGGLT